MLASPALAQATDGSADVLISLAPLLLFSILFGIGNFFLARRIEGASPVLWFILSILPVVNFLFFYYVFYKIVFAVLDHLRAIRSERQPRS